MGFLSSKDNKIVAQILTSIDANHDTVAAIALGGVMVGVVALSICTWKETKTSKAVEKLPIPTEEQKHKVLKQGLSALQGNTQFDVIVLGSGVGGLASAAILAREGYKVLVLEQHDVAGGNTHTFVEDGYEFDTGLHYCGGMGNNDDNGSFRPLMDYCTEGHVEWAPMAEEYDLAKLPAAGDQLAVHYDWNITIARLKEMFPSEHKAIDEIFRAIHHIMRWFPVYLVAKRTPAWFGGVLDYLFASKFSLFEKTASEVLDGLTQNTKLKGMLTYMYGDCGDIPARMAFTMQALIWDHYHKGSFYPVGGPSVISYHMARVIQKHGGAVCVRSPVSNLLLDTKGRAIGVQVRETKLYAKNIISAIAVHHTIKLVPKAYQDRVKSHVEFLQHPDIVPPTSMNTMFIGLEGTAEELNLPKCNTWVFPSWDHNENWKRFQTNPTDFPVAFVSFASAKDPSYASRLGPHKQVATLIVPCLFDEVAAYKDDRVKHRSAEYQAKKETFQKALRATFVREFPHLESRIRYVDVGTAVTNDFYLGTHQGAIYGLAHTPHRFANPVTPFFLKGAIPNLYLTGQDTLTCGVLSAFLSGAITAGCVSKKSLLHTLPLFPADLLWKE